MCGRQTNHPINDPLARVTLEQKAPNMTTYRYIANPTTPDLTALEKPFGLLDYDTRWALMAHGGPYEVLSDAGWIDQVLPPVWRGRLTYRVKPGPVRREVVNNEMYMTSRGTIACNAKLEGATPVRVTYTVIAGKIDPKSYRVEAR